MRNVFDDSHVKQNMKKKTSHWISGAQLSNIFENDPSAF